MSDEKPKPTSTDIMAAIERVGAQVSALAKAVDALAGTLAEHSAKLDAIRSAPTGAAPRASADFGPPPPASTWPTVFPNYGRSKGQPIAGALPGDLDYYADGARRSLADPNKARWHKNERALLAAIEAERGGASPAQATLPPGGGSIEGAPAGAPPADDDFTPF